MNGKSLDSEIRAMVKAFGALPKGELRERERRAVWELRRVLGKELQRQVEEVEAAYKVLGAPGDWGYGTPEGSAWWKLLQAWNAVEVGGSRKVIGNR